ncbi:MULTISPECIES: hypothetical protein [Vibrio]|uniref:Uncharacterized protein n=1 Tax=Vibrio algicola TaxID=2662262 RepID=A0A5Q0TGK9_9VIBR|nr:MULTISPECIES: hypothetical protein [Vibrio]MBD1577355.1 hypothetical protein [Vibrio sp. S11_S32]
MLYKEKTLKCKSIVIAFIFTLLVVIMLTMSAFTNLKSRINDVILPSVVMDLGFVA